MFPINTDASAFASSTSAWDDVLSLHNGVLSLHKFVQIFKGPLSEDPHMTESGALAMIDEHLTLAKRA